MSRELSANFDSKDDLQRSLSGRVAKIENNVRFVRHVRVKGKKM
jgi:hypothetical protein